MSLHVQVNVVVLQENQQAIAKRKKSKGTFVGGKYVEYKGKEVAQDDVGQARVTEKR